jgi:two-component system, chemotaxis family, chemotaxis protein CheY
MKIMIVDDEKQDSTLMRSVAIPLGYTVQSHSDYAEGVQKGETQRFDMIFVGMHQQASDSLDAVRRIRKSAPNRSTLIVMVSPTEDIPGLRKAIGEGADLFLVKPISGERLRRMLTAFPEWKQTRHAARLPLVTDVLCTWNGRQFRGRSFNISESGMLLQSQGIQELAVGEEVRLEFKIGEIHSSLNLFARVARKEGTDRVGVAFDKLTPEDINAIHVYVTGRMKDAARPAPDYLEDIRSSRLIRPS